MEGALKRKISFFTGYQNKWFVLADDGNIKQFDTQPTVRNQKPKWTMNIILADVTTKDDGLRFVVTACNGRTLKLKAPNKDEREKWTKLFKIINEKHFPLIYSKKEDEEGLGPKTQEISSDKKRSQEISSDKKRSQELFKNMSLKPKRNYTMVAAIDFGSAYSGTAFSFKSEFTRNPLHIYVMEGVGRINNMSTKIPTVLLLNPDKKFEAFGNEAEDKYAKLMIHDPQYANQCYYFIRFKMQLYNRDLKKSLTITDISGKKEMKAVDVFAACIEYLKNATFTRAKEQISKLEEGDIHWVLTVPAIWTEAARQFMIDAAEKSGIYEDNLTLALEPEAAALCCRSLEIEKKDKGQSPQLGSFSPGSSFLVVDLGGGTVDITANEVMATGQIKEIHSATGGPWGGNMINIKIWSLLQEIFGTEVLSTFAVKNREDYLDLVRDIERQKRSFKSDSKCTIELPAPLTIEVKKNPDMVAAKYKGKAEINRNKLHIIPEVLKSIFKEGIDQIIGYVQKLLNEPETSKVKSILLVGGYASCGLLVHAIKEHFNELTVICPLQPDVIVLKGAVIMGHMETPIVGRMAKYHYGIALASGEQKSNFDGSHTSFPTSPLEFYTIIPKGSPIQVNAVVTEYDFPIDVNQEEAYIQIYASEDKHPPKLISEESCRKFGHIRIKLPLFRRTTKLRIVISNDETEFKVVAREEHTGKCFVGVCRFLD